MNMEQFAQDGQDIKIIEKLITKVQDMLTPGEKNRLYRSTEKTCGDNFTGQYHH